MQSLNSNKKPLISGHTFVGTSFFLSVDVNNSLMKFAQVLGHFRSFVYDFIVITKY
jgi:hypothetical protein